MNEWLIAILFFALALLISEYYNRRIQIIHEERIRELKHYSVERKRGEANCQYVKTVKTDTPRVKTPVKNRST